MLSVFILNSLAPCASPVQAQQPAPATVAAAASGGTMTLAGLRAPVTVRRDERGIPHIEARHEADLYFAQGYATAADRLWQMDLLRRTARGELAEIFGAPALDEDKRHRLYGFAALSETLAAKTSVMTRAALEAYAAGVNAYIETRDGSDGRKLPLEFQILQYKPRPWRPADSLVIGKIFAETLSTTWQTDLMRAALADLPSERRAELLPETSPLDVLVVGSDRATAPASDGQQPKTGGKKSKAADKPKLSATPLFSSRPSSSASTALLPADEADRSALFAQAAQATEAMQRSLSRVGLYVPDRAASNNWVVSGKRTQTGKPLLANDPHLPASAPSIWHLVDLHAPGIHVAGVTAPGAPGVVIGHNERIAWGVTNLGPDVQDLYREQFTDARTYQTSIGARQAEVRREEIKVRKSFFDAATEMVNFDVTVTRHGPIILERGGARYALRWTALDPDMIEFEAFYKLNRARDWKEFQAALSQYRGPTQNFVYADRKGHIGYYGAGMIPVRQTGDGSLPYDGAFDEGEWTGFIPFNALPHNYDPPSGVIVTANQRIVGADYPQHLTHEWASPYRARRIYDLLQATPKLSVDDFRRIQADVYSLGGAAFARGIVDAGRTLQPGGEVGVIQTNQGTIRIALLPHDAPKTTENFIRLAARGYYDGIIFHRIIKGFMIQGGDPTGTGRGGESAFGGSFADEINPQSPLYQRGYTKGTVAMANAGPDTNGSLFFIMHGNYPLPPNYTIFGRVIEGQEVVDKIANTATGGNDRPLEPVKMERVSIEDKFRDALPVFASWDGQVHADSRGAPLVAEMRAAFRRRIYSAALGAERARQFRLANDDTLIDRLITERPAAWLPVEFKDYGDLLRACYADAREALTKRLGIDEAQWTWGRYAPARFPHPLAAAPLIGQQFAIPSFPLNGSGFSAGPTVNVGANVSMRLIADPNNWDNTRHGLALGESGDPTNPHWSDQLADWRAVTPRPLAFSKQAVAAATTETLVLMPSKQGKSH